MVIAAATLAIGLGIAYVVITTLSLKKTRLALKAEANQIIADAHQKHTELVGDFVGGCTERLKPWWSELEREAFGFNDTERWIAETDKVLKGLEWDGLTNPAHILHQPRGQVIEAQVGISPLAQEQVDVYSWGHGLIATRGHRGPPPSPLPRKRKREAPIGNASGV